MRSICLWMIFLVFFTCFGCGEDEKALPFTPYNTPPEPYNEPVKKLIELSIPIVDGTFVVSAGSFQSFKFEVTDDMLNPTIEGKFEVIELDANVFVFDEINFKNWKANVGGVKVWFQANRVAAGKINRQLIPDIYYLVLDNTFSLFAPKTIQIKLDLKYSKWV